MNPNQQSRFRQIITLGLITATLAGLFVTLSRVQQDLSPNDASAASAENYCKVGVNFATWDRYLDLDMVTEAGSLGYGYGLVITVGAPSGEDRPFSSFESTVIAMDNLCASGVIPVLRSCVGREACDFKTAKEQAEYINKVAEQTSCPIMYAACGHNEAVSEGIAAEECKNTAGNAALVAKCEKERMYNEGKWMKECVSAIKPNEKLKLTTTTFNATIPSFKETTADFIKGYGSGDMAEDFDCLAFNTYDGVSGKKATDFIKEFIEGTPALAKFEKYCINETGIITYPSPGQVSSNPSSVANAQVMKDILDNYGDKIDYVLGYNWTGGNPDPNFTKFIVEDKGATAIQALCKGTVQLPKGDLTEVPGQEDVEPGEEPGEEEEAPSTNNGGSGSNNSNGGGKPPTSSSSSGLPPLPAASNSAGRPDSIPRGADSGATCLLQNVNMNYPFQLFESPTVFDSKICSSNGGNWHFGAFTSAPKPGDVPQFQFENLASKPNIVSSYREEEQGVHDKLWFACYNATTVCDAREVNKGTVPRQTVSGTCGALDATPTASPDGKLDLSDLSNFASKYGMTCTDKNTTYSGCGALDRNANGVIDLPDLSHFANFYGKASCK